MGAETSPCAFIRFVGDHGLRRAQPILQKLFVPAVLDAGRLVIARRLMTIAGARACAFPHAVEMMQELAKHREMVAAGFGFAADAAHHGMQCVHRRFSLFDGVGWIERKRTPS